MLLLAISIVAAIYVQPLLEQQNISKVEYESPDLIKPLELEYTISEGIGESEFLPYLLDSHNGVLYLYNWGDGVIYTCSNGELKTYLYVPGSKDNKYVWDLDYLKGKPLLITGDNIYLETSHYNNMYSMMQVEVSQNRIYSFNFRRGNKSEYDLYVFSDKMIYDGECGVSGISHENADGRMVKGYNVYMASVGSTLYYANDIEAIIYKYNIASNVSESVEVKYDGYSGIMKGHRSASKEIAEGGRGNLKRLLVSLDVLESGLYIVAADDQRKYVLLHCDREGRLQGVYTILVNKDKSFLYYAKVYEKSSFQKCLAVLSHDKVENGYSRILYNFNLPKERIQ